MTVDALVARLGLAPHPEGGYYRETYREPGGASTAILYLLPAGANSRLHRIASDELWHWHLGGPLEIVELIEGAPAKITVLGSGLDRGETVQHAVPAGRWFGARPRPGTEWTLAGCTVAPAFDFSRFELGRRDELLKAFPEAAPLIRELTP